MSLLFVRLVLELSLSEPTTVLRLERQKRSCLWWLDLLALERGPTGTRIVAGGVVW
jgi:hypothetical protein